MAKRMEGSAFTSWLVHGVIVLCSVGVPGAWGQGQKGFLNIDCGSTAPYVDPVTSINWVPDADYITTGLNYAGVPNAVPTYSNFSELKTLRYFNNPYPKNCYTLPVTKNDSYLLRASFYYGSYDKAAFPPSFEMSIDATVIANITTDATAMQYEEFTIRSENDVIYLCLSRDASGSVPFISAISLRPAPYYGQFETFLTTQYMRTRRRWNFGGSTMIRYPEDPSDRYWDFQGNDSSSLQQTATPIQVLTTTHPISMDYIGDLTVPSMVLETAVTTSGNLTVSSLNNESAISNAYLLLWFAELNPAANLTSREFMIEVPTFVKQYYEDAFNLSSPPSAYTADYWYFYTFGPFDPTSNIVLYPISPSTLGPILNALEFFEQTEDFSFKTNAQDALAIDAIKTAMNLSAWTGDPCLPYPHSWINCSNDDVPYITTIDLTNYNLTTTIAPEFADLSGLTSLLLDHNALIGPLPDLRTLTHLKILHLQNNMLNGSLDVLTSLPLTELFVQNNNFSGTIPTIFLSESNNNTLNFKYSGNQFLQNGTTTNGTKSKSNIGVIIGPIVGGIVVCGVVIFLLIFYYILPRRQQNQDHNKIIRDNKLSNPSNAYGTNHVGGAKAFTLETVVAATENFNKEIGRGGFGPVYYGKFSNGQEAAIKVLENTSRQGTREFFNEVDLLSKIHHKNLVALLGCCQEDNKRMLIYEFLHNGSLRDHLYGPFVLENGALDWKMRLNIALNAAQGLDYLHTACVPSIIHRDIKSSNILLSKNLEHAKVGDFGLSRLLFEEDNSHVSTLVKGTAGYLDPEYISTQCLSIKSDVFSFGVVLLELITGRLPIDQTRLDKSDWNICDSVRSDLHQGNIDKVLDPLVKSSHSNVDSLWKVAEVAMQCVEPKSMHRPTMNEVIQELKSAINMEGTTPIHSEEASTNAHGFSTTSGYSTGFFDEVINKPTAR